MEYSFIELSDILESIACGIWTWHPKTGAFNFSQQWVRILGYSDSEHLPQVYETRTERIHPDDMPAVESNISDIWLHGATRGAHTFRILHRSGNYIEVHEQYAVQKKDASGCPIVISGTMQILSSLYVKEKNIESTLPLEISVQGMIDSIPLGCILIDNNHHIIECNDKFMALTNAESKIELLNSFIDYLPKLQQNGFSSKEIMKKNIVAAFKTGYTAFNFTYGDSNGGFLLSETVFIRIIWNGKPFLLGMIIDFRDIIAEHNKSRERDKYIQMMMDFTPLICSIWDSDGNMIDCNMEAVKRLETGTKEAYINQFYNLSPEYQPNGKSSREMASYYISQTIETGFQQFLWVYNTAKGEPVPVETSLYRVSWNNDYRILAYSADLREINKANEKIKRNTAMLQAVNKVATMLLNAHRDDFHGIVQLSLEIIGESAESVCHSIWRNKRNANGDLCADKLFQAKCDKSTEDLCLSTAIDYKTYIPEWDEGTEDRQILFYNSDSSDRKTQALGCKMEKRSLVLVPITANSKFWGFTCFSYKDDINKLSQDELGILSSGGMMIASAILRDEMTKELVVATEKALASVRTKNEFLARMSHEIRTPMNAVVGMSTVAANTDDINKIRNCLEVVKNSSNQLLRLINDILDMASIDLGKISITEGPFDFNEMLGSVKDMLMPQINEKNLIFKTSLPDAFSRPVLGDEKRLAQVITNLLTNAVKFTANGGEISLKITEVPIDSHSSKIITEVTDNGIGISKEAQSNIFDMFEQADGSITRRFGGTGLGLAISKNILDLMGGTISVKSNQGHGSTFTIELPVKWGVPFDCKDEPSPPCNIPDWTGRCILLVEDLDINQIIASELLEPTCVEIDYAENGQQAVDMFKNSPEKYDLILMDIQMPVMDGLTATKKIRDMDISSAKSVPIYSMTANAYDEDKNDCLEAGMNGYILKPIDINNLYEVMNRQSNRL